MPPHLFISLFLLGIGLAVPNSGFGASSIYGLEGYQEPDGDESGERWEGEKEIDRQEIRVKGMKWNGMEWIERRWE